MMWWLILACGGGDGKAPETVAPSTDAPDTPGPVTPDTPDTPDLPSATESDWGGITEPDPKPKNTRQLKRMTVAQARDSMVQISGGIHWGEEGDSDWDAYADTLGVADFQLRVEHDRSPSVMFQKFLDDAASATCSGWLTAEDSHFHSIDDPESTERADVRENILGLRWKIQGKSKTTEDTIIDDYELLFATVHQRTDSTQSAWQTVCVAMFTHPDFFMY